MKDNSSTFYWDSSALLTLLFDETQTKRLRRFVQSSRSLPGYTSFFTLIEMESALERRVFEGSLKVDVAEVRTAFGRLETGLTLIWPDGRLVSTARRCVLEYRLRPADALQLASAMELATEMEDVRFICLDEKLFKAAQAAGIAHVLK